MFAAAERVCVYRGVEEGLRWLLLGASRLPGLESAGPAAKRKSGRMKRRGERLLFLTGMAASADARVPTAGDQGHCVGGHAPAALLARQCPGDDVAEDDPANEQGDSVGAQHGCNEATHSAEDDAEMDFQMGAHGVPSRYGGR